MVGVRGWATLGSCLAALSGCGDTGEAVSLGRAAVARDELRPRGEALWSDELPEGAQDPAEGAQVSIRGCDFAIGTAVQLPGLPPSTLVFLHRTPSAEAPEWCTDGYVVLGTSAQAGVSLDLVRHPVLPILVADFSFKVTPSGSAHSHLAIAQVDPFTGAVVRQTGLSAFGLVPSAGNVYDGALMLERNGTLVVAGSKDGILPGEIGSGESYQAVWRHFVHGNRESPSPNEVTAF